MVHEASDADRMTRGYLHLADDASTFCYAGAKRYRMIDPLVAVTAVLEHRHLQPTGSERSALGAVLERLSRGDRDR
jgi:hypothetical protein